jgi:hypothetical protein
MTMKRSKRALRILSSRPSSWPWPAAATATRPVAARTPPTTSRSTPATAGQVVGTITFEGAAPDPQPIDMRGEQACADKHDGQPMDRPVVVGDDGGLKNVYVYVREGLPAGSWPAADQEVELDQDGCLYIPRVLGLQTGQTLRIRNSDGLLHNVNARPTNQRGFNISQPTNMTTNRSFAQPEVMIPVRCDVHGWMAAYIGVQSHPYFAVTPENGSTGSRTCRQAST